MMSVMPFTLVQLTDPHIGADWSDDPVGALRRAVTAIRKTLGSPPDALLVSGDIANAALAEEYAQARTELETLRCPVFPIPGNHDRDGPLRTAFGAPPPIAADTFSYAVALGPVRLVALDSTRPGEPGGELDSARLQRLDEALAADKATPTLLAMHHPPIETGLPAMDEIGIPGGERAALAAVLARHPQVQMIACGHVHRAIVGSLAGIPVLAIPSCDVQLALDLHSSELRFVDEPPSFAVHLLAGDRLVAHVQPIATNAA
jgi:3',5'-cyclic AMP phosphodiesterase CpdA